MDYCHPNHPDCVTGVTCSDCNATWNPEIHVAGGLVTFSNDLIITSIKDKKPVFDLLISVDPNPSNGIFNIRTSDNNSKDIVYGQIYSTSGTLLNRFTMDSGQSTLDLSDYPKGIYIMKVYAGKYLTTKKLVIQ